VGRSCRGIGGTESSGVDVDAENDTSKSDFEVDILLLWPRLLLYPREGFEGIFDVFCESPETSKVGTAKASQGTVPAQSQSNTPTYGL